MSKIFIQDFIFQPARKTAAEWEAENPVLKDGEVGVELGDPAAVKIGDGVTPWNGLEYSLNNAAKQDKWAETAESNTSDGKKRTTLTGKAGHYLTLKSQESISVEGRGIELKPSNGCLKLNSGNGSGKVKVQNVAEPTAPTEAATKNYVDTHTASGQESKSGSISLTVTCARNSDKSVTSTVAAEFGYHITGNIMLLYSKEAPQAVSIPAGEHIVGIEGSVPHGMTVSLPEMFPFEEQYSTGIPAGFVRSANSTESEVRNLLLVNKGGGAFRIFQQGKTYISNEDSATYACISAVVPVE